MKKTLFYCTACSIKITNDDHCEELDQVSCPNCNSLIYERINLIPSVYVLVNDSMPGICKIGYTERAIEKRIQELSRASGVPTDFSLALLFEATDRIQTEKIIHRELHPWRVSDRSEFFHLSPMQAYERIKKTLDSEPIYYNYNMIQLQNKNDSDTDRYCHLCQAKLVKRQYLLNGLLCEYWCPNCNNFY